MEHEVKDKPGAKPRPAPAEPLVGYHVHYISDEGDVLHAVVAHVNGDGTLVLSVLGRNGHWLAHGPCSRGTLAGCWKP